MIRHVIRIKETIATVVAEEQYVPVAEAEIRRQRRLLEDYLAVDSAMLSALESYHVSVEAPAIVRRMAAAGARAGVGPMAAVAGALAEYALRAMQDAGATHALVDNGGDIAMLLSKPATVGIFTGPAKIKNIGLKFPPQRRILGVCTSSGTVGHSLSFGQADAAVVVARDVCLADALATAMGNAIQQAEPRQIRKAMRRFLLPDVEGLLVVIDDLLCLCGNLPEIVPVHSDLSKISA